MKQHEQAQIFLRKAKQDEELLDFIFTSLKVSDEIFGFHSQQAAEKLLKALLSHLGISFKRTHNLLTLMDLLKDAKYAPPKKLSRLDELTPFGTIVRYEEPGSDLQLNRKAVRKRICDLRIWVESKMEEHKVRNK